MTDAYHDMRQIANNIVNAEILVSKHNMHNVYGLFLISLYESGHASLHALNCFVS